MNRFIGLFDSGIGGLTVLKQIITSLPDENTVYFGDMGRAPYGSRSSKVINRYSEQIVKYLIEKYDLKLIVTACNTVSAVSLSYLRERFSIPITGIIDTVPQKAVEASKSGNIGVIGTRVTIRSGVYQRMIKDLDKAINIFSQECPLLIHLVEEGWSNEPATKMILGEYLSNLKHAHIDTLILGCTHYPILQPIIREYLGDDIVIIDPAIECLKEIEKHLSESGKLNKDNYPERLYLVTDNPDAFRTNGERYLDRKIHKVNLVSIGDLECQV
jgi:glutamate racemase